jgi:hypothetical protein
VENFIFFSNCSVPKQQQKSLVPQFFPLHFGPFVQIFLFLICLIFLFFEKGLKKDNVNSMKKINNFKNCMLKAEKKFEVVIVKVTTTTTILINNSINSNNNDDDDDNDDNNYH